MSPYWKLKNYHSAAWPIKSEKFNCNNKLMLLVTPCFLGFFFFTFTSPLYTSDFEIHFQHHFPLTWIYCLYLTSFVRSASCPFFFPSRLRDPVASRYGVLSVSSRGCLCLLRAPTGRPQPGKLHAYLIWNWIMRISIFGWSFTSAHSLTSFHVPTLSSTM